MKITATHIEEYISGELSGKDLIVFEKQLAKDVDLQKSIKIHRQIDQVLKEYDSPVEDLEYEQEKERLSPILQKFNRKHFVDEDTTTEFEVPLSLVLETTPVQKVNSTKIRELAPILTLATAVTLLVFIVAPWNIISAPHLADMYFEPYKIKSTPKGQVMYWNNAGRVEYRAYNYDNLYSNWNKKNSISKWIRGNNNIKPTLKIGENYQKIGEGNAFACGEFFSISLEDEERFNFSKESATNAIYNPSLSRILKQRDNQIGLSYNNIKTLNAYTMGKIGVTYDKEPLHIGQQLTLSSPYSNGAWGGLASNWYWNNSSDKRIIDSTSQSHTFNNEGGIIFSNSSKPMIMNDSTFISQLEATGTNRFKEVIVEEYWADYVFDKEYSPQIKDTDSDSINKQIIFPYKKSSIFFLKAKTAKTPRSENSGAYGLMDSNGRWFYPIEINTKQLLLEGSNHYQNEEIEKAIASFGQVINNSSEEKYVSTANWYLALCYLKQNKPEEAKPLLRKAITYGEKARAILKQLE